jgi:hypothetical protein
MTIKFTLLVLVVVLSAGNCLGQDSLCAGSFYPSGITLEYGLGHYSVEDEYISNEKYTGTLPGYSIRWARHHDTHVYHLDMTYRNSDEIENYNVSTDITQFTLNQGFLYPLRDISLFHRDLHLWLGPSTEFFFFYNDQDIAVSGFDYAQSAAGLFSLGVNANGIYPVRNNLQLESAMNLTILSLGFRLVDNEEGDESAAKFLTLVSGLNSAFDLRARFLISRRLSVTLAYEFEMTRVRAWDSLLSASDNIVIGLAYGF